MLAVFRQRDRRASPMVPGGAPRPVHPHPHAGGRPESEPVQLGGYFNLRGPAPTGFSRFNRYRRDGAGRVASESEPPLLRRSMTDFTSGMRIEIPPGGLPAKHVLPGNGPAPAGFSRFN